MCTKLTAIAGLLLSIVSTGAWAGPGGYSGGGGDLLSPDRDSAWFTGDRTVKACLQSGSDYPYSADQLREFVSTSIEIWRSYAERKGILTRNVGERPAFTYSLLPACDGTEDLTFFFGMETKLIRKAKTRFNRPAAFAVRTSYDLDQAWGRGFIWFANPKDLPPSDFPDFTDANAFKILMTHELSHVMGNAEIQGTIAAQDIVAQIKSFQDEHPQGDRDTYFNLKYMNQVDWFNELVIGFLVDLPLKVIGSGISISGQPDYAATIMGRPLVYPAHFVINLKGNDQGAEVVVEDPQGKTVLPVEINYNSLEGARSEWGAETFKVVKRDPNTSGGIKTTSEHVRSTSLYGKLKMPTGENALLVFHRGGNDSGPLEIEYIGSDLTPHVFFRADWYRTMHGW